MRKSLIHSDLLFPIKPLCREHSGFLMQIFKRQMLCIR
uniref:Uncharacterized protein n=1 Tax=Siphoviridae sp. ctGz830 TaxID=2827825 RepID=A0A8S5T9H9_9CAUD|nr:MAG TPA: hypothetical protein [Siphoviridae sp. ctGz830]